MARMRWSDDDHRRRVLYRKILCASAAIALAGVCALVLWPTTILSQSGRSDVFAHPGIVIDRVTSKPISADIHAYASAKGRTLSGGCAAYDESVDATRSDFTGRFTLTVDRRLHSYVISYCSNGYISRSDTANSNLTDGSRVDGDPVTLFPDNVDETAYVAALRAEFSRSASELRYIGSAKPDYYQAALARLAHDPSFVADPVQKGLLDGAGAVRPLAVPAPPSNLRVQ